MDTLPVDLADPKFSLAPERYDGVLMTHTIREWSAEDVQRFIGLVHSALKPGGAVVLDMVATRRLGEFPAASAAVGLGPAYFLVSASNDQHEHRLEDVKKWLSNAGFADAEFVQVAPTCNPYSSAMCRALVARRN